MQEMDQVDHILEQWQQERPDIDPSPMAVFGRLHRLSRLVGDHVQAAYAQHGLDRGEFDVLATLRRAGPPFELSPTALTASLMLTSGGMTARLDRLEDAGLIRRRPAARDRRRVVVTLTGTGRERVDAAVESGLRAEAAILEGLSSERRRQLVDALRDLLTHAVRSP